MCRWAAVRERPTRGNRGADGKDIHGSSHPCTSSSLQVKGRGLIMSGKRTEREDHHAHEHDDDHTSHGHSHGHDHGSHGHGHGGHGSHGHTHGVIDPSITTTARGLWALKCSFAVLMAAT